VGRSPGGGYGDRQHRDPGKETANAVVGHVQRRAHQHHSPAFDGRPEAGVHTGVPEKGGAVAAGTDRPPGGGLGTTQPQACRVGPGARQGGLEDPRLQSLAITLSVNRGGGGGQERE